VAGEKESMIEETPTKRLVLDANILLRAMLGSSVQRLIEGYKDSVAFYSPDICFEGARKYIGKIAAARGFDSAPGLAILYQLAELIQAVEISLYVRHEVSARLRIASRDMDDWPIVATALLLDCPVWTEDQDFFGSGVATWTTQNIELYLRDG
jgi:predicted nucleic acid-binding protein